MKWLIEDPSGNIHAVREDKGMWWGLENIKAENLPQLANVFSNLLQWYLMREEVGYYNGYTWIRLP